MTTDKYFFEPRLLQRQSRSVHTYAITLGLLTGMFALRVVGQAVQYWSPQPYLPPFTAFQGSHLPYWLLLSVQLTILVIMMCISWRAKAGALIPNRTTGNILGWFGGIYMFGSLSRILIGALVPAAPVWFSTWIPAVFHIVLAAYVLTLCCYHLHLSIPTVMEK